LGQQQGNKKGKYMNGGSGCRWAVWLNLKHVFFFFAL
jgi:hypothetical protein